MESKPFEIHFPTRVIFGEEVANRLAEFLQGDRPILVVTGGQSATTNKRVLEVLGSLQGKRVVRYSGITPNPKSTAINEAADLGRVNAVGTVVGIGGGSVLDAAKAVAVAIGSGQLVEHFMRNNLEAPASTLPIIAIPTTAGTGSETSRGAIVTDVERKQKKGLRGKKLQPILALVDPTLTYSLPPPLTAETGFDILTHAIETFLSRAASPVTRLLSERAIEVVAQYLPAAISDGGDVAARRNLLMASTMMGFNLGHSTTCLPHRLQYPLGALTDSSHPRGLAALYPAWCAHVNRYAPADCVRLARVLHESRFGGTSDAQGAIPPFPATVQDFIRAIGMTHQLRDFGINTDDCRRMAAAVDGNLTTDPGDTSAESIIRIYEESW